MAWLSLADAAGYLVLKADPSVLRIPLRCVFYRSNDRWIAHCLEFDLLGTGETTASALEQLTEAIRIQIEFSLENHNPRNLFAPVDAESHRMFAAGKVVA